MLFSSTFFLLYFLPVFLSVYFLIPPRFKNYFILFASVLFYAWGAPKFVWILAAAVIFDFFIANLIHKNEGRKRKAILFFGVAVNVGMLLYFKYFNFFMENTNALLNSVGIKQVEFTKVVLPIGISFFVFHELSYIIDVYRKVKPPMKSIVDYGLYIFLFPQLIAGPIIRFNEIADQIQNRNYQDNIDNRILGLLRFTIGLAKKVLIANVLGAEADRIFHSPFEELNSSSAWLGILCYTFQIYFDFSGYSDMAIGLARTMGFIFPENFNFPYISQSITEFWRRWHISLSRWMRDYLYFPLGGNKVSVPRMYFNLCLVFLISGFWHGAEWTFVLWGAYHGLFLIFDRLFLDKLTANLYKPIKIIFTFLIVINGWVLFRARDISQALLFYKKMFSFSFEPHYLSLHVWVALIIASVFSFLNFSGKVSLFRLEENKIILTTGRALFSAMSIIIILIICVGELATTGFNPFIYFKF